MFWFFNMLYSIRYINIITNYSKSFIWLFVQFAKHFIEYLEVLPKHRISQHKLQIKKLFIFASCNYP
jgi:hypothetical protein